MITSKDIFIKDEMLCISIAKPCTGLRGFDLSSQRPSAILFRNGNLIEVNWLGIKLIDDKRCLYFDSKQFNSNLPIPAIELSNTLRPNAFEHLERLALALEKIEEMDKPSIELDWNFSSLPLSNIYFTKDGVLLLPSKSGDLIDVLMLDEDRFIDREAWYVHNEANNFGKAHWLFQLTYYALSTKIPFEPQDVRDCSFKPIPLELFFIGSQTNATRDTSNYVFSFCKFIDKVFSMSKKEMYQVSNPYKYFIDTIAKVQIQTTINDYVITNSTVYKDYLQKLNKKANIRRFLRKKGVALVALIVAITVAISIAWYYISLAIAPPTTAGLPKEEIISSYYKAVNDLDIQGVNDSLAHGCKSPDEVTVTNLEVSRKVRYAYENKNIIANAQTWLDEGMPAIAQGAMVYGITNLNVVVIDDYTAIATLDFYKPYEGDDESINEIYTTQMKDNEDVSTAASVLTAVYKETVKFTFVEKKTWLEISCIEILEDTLSQIYVVPYDV